MKVRAYWRVRRWRWRWPRRRRRLPADFKAKADALLKKSYPADGPGRGGDRHRRRQDRLCGRARAWPMSRRKRRSRRTPSSASARSPSNFPRRSCCSWSARGKSRSTTNCRKFFPDYPQARRRRDGRAAAQPHRRRAELYRHPRLDGRGTIPARPYTTEQMIAEFRDLPSPSKPGEKWAYNNSGYVLVGAVIEKVTGKPWHAMSRSGSPGRSASPPSATACWKPRRRTWPRAIPSRRARSRRRRQST